MSYKLLAEVDAEFKNTEALNAKLAALETSLKAAIQKLNDLNVPAAGGVAALRAHFAGGAAQSQKDKLRADIESIKAKIMMWNNSPNLGKITINQVTGEVLTEKKNWDKMVVYDHAAEAQGMTRIYIVGGRLFWDAAGVFPVHTFATQVPGFDGPAPRPDFFNSGHADDALMYVMTAQGHFHVDLPERGRRHHSSLMAGANVACAGEMSVNNGTITMLSNDSGHYDPNLMHFIQVLHELSKPPNNVLINFTIKAIWICPRPLDPAYQERDIDVRTHLIEGEYNLNTFLSRCLGKNAPGAGMADVNELYAYNNLLKAYTSFVTNEFEMADLGYEWKPDANPPGVYRLGTNVHVPSQLVRSEIKNAMFKLRGQVRTSGRRVADPHLPKQLWDRSQNKFRPS